MSGGKTATGGRKTEGSGNETGVSGGKTEKTRSTMTTDRTETGEITVQLNGKARALPEGLTVTELLESLELNPQLVVVERNREILDRSEYAQTRVEDEDVLELVHFVGGG